MPQSNDKQGKLGHYPSFRTIDKGAILLNNEASLFQKLNCKSPS